MRIARTEAIYARVLKRLPSAQRALAKAVVAVPQIVPVPIRPLEWLTAAPSRQTVSFECKGRATLADLYRPAVSGRQPAVVMTLGANDLGARDPRAITLATTLARSGFLTLVVVGAPRMVDSDVLDPLGILEAPAVTAAAFDYLAGQTGVDNGRIGLVGVCVGASACLLAAARAELAHRVAFVFAIGPYYCLRDLLRATVSGFARSKDGQCRPWSAEAWSRQRTHDWLLSVLTPDDRTRVREVLERGERSSPDCLSAQAAAVFHLASGVTVESADEYIDALGEDFVSALREASPAGQLAGLRAATYVMHGVADRVVPVDESRRLIGALEGQVPLRYAEFELFEHVDATRPMSVVRLVREVWRLVQHVRPLMQAAG